MLTDSPAKILSYRGCGVTAADVAFIRELITAHPEKSRRALSVELCRAWGWVQANGATRDMVCRSLMLELHRKGHIRLPLVRQVPKNPLARRSPPAAVKLERTPIETTLNDLGPLTIREVRRSAEEALLNGLIQELHYLGYTQPVGEHLKFLVFAGERPLACFLWSSPPRHLGPRDRFIGWSKEARRANISLVAYNTRFLILPWVKVPHLASHLLGRMTALLSQEWERVYAHPVYFAETFVDPERFKGTCYRAANWVYLGGTTGRGKDDLTHRANRPIKDVFGISLSRKFREKLGAIS